MRKIFTADLHIHEFSKDSVTTEFGTSLKLEELLSAIEQMCVYAVDNDIKEIYFGGDLIHHNNVVYARPFSRFKKLLRKYSDITFVAYCGNHEFGKADGTDNALDLLEDDNIKIVRGVTVQGNTTIIPHSRTLHEDVKSCKPNDILMSHFALSEARADSGFQKFTKFSINDLKKFKLVLIGDYHTPQMIKKSEKGVETRIYYPGSPIPFTRAEIESKRFLVFDDETLEVESVPITGYRKYVDVVLEEGVDLKAVMQKIEESKAAGNYVFVKNYLKSRPPEIRELSNDIICLDLYEPEFNIRGITTSMTEDEKHRKYMEINHVPEELRDVYMSVLNSVLSNMKETV